jgi:hypothetical protein
VLIAEVGIAVCGVTAIYLSQDQRESRRKWSSVFGLAGQPFWIVETIGAGQWLILGLCALYTWSWLRGFHGYWVKPWLLSRKP